MTFNIGASRLFASMPTAMPTAAPSVASSADINAQLQAIRQEALQLQATMQALQAQLDAMTQAQTPAPPLAPPAPAPATPQPLGFTLPSLSSLIDRLLNWFSPAPTPTPSNPGTPTGPKPPTAKGTTEFVISSFNVLGSSHTIPGRSERPGMDVGTTRIRRAVQLLDQHKVDLVGFQEFQPDQVKVFLQVAGDKYGVYPGMKLGRGPNVNSIAWRKDKFDLVKADTIPIPYFKGKLVKMPVIRLRDKKTGQEFYIANFHNPASTKKNPGNEHNRDKATQLEIDLVNRLRKQTGLPVFVTGDMNEREEFFNKMTQGANMNAANETPSGKPAKNIGIDWIMGTQDVKFSHYVKDKGALVQRTSDHPMIVSRARIEPPKR